VALRPTPWTAAAAGAVAALAWPFLWDRFGAEAASGAGIGLVVASLLLIALPAHALVIGFARPERTDARSIDRPLLVRIACWTLAAAATTLVRSAAVG
jgi:hypothetical protein